MTTFAITMTPSAHRYNVIYLYKRKKITGFYEYHKLNNDMNDGDCDYNCVDVNLMLLMIMMILMMMLMMITVVIRMVHFRYNEPTSANVTPSPTSTTGK